MMALRLFTLMVFLAALAVPGLAPAHCAPPELPAVSMHHGDHHAPPASKPDKAKHDCIGCALRFAAPPRLARSETHAASPEAAPPAPLKGLLLLPEPRPPRA